MVSRIAVYSKITDTRGAVRQKSLQDLPISGKIQKVELVDIYTVNKKLSDKELKESASILANPVTEWAKIRVKSQESRVQNEIIIGNDNYTLDAKRYTLFDWAIEIGFLPGVTDNVGSTTRQAIEDHLKVKFSEEEGVYSSQVTFLTGTLTQKDVQILVDSLYNPLIQRAQVKSSVQYKKDGGMDFVVPKVELHHSPKVLEVDLNVSDEELAKIGKEGIKDSGGERRGPLAMELDYMKAIQNYFKNKKRNPTDVELEAIGQTWSEHCKHTIFADPIDEVKDGLFKTYIKNATEKISKKDFIAKVFNDNSGAINFDDKYLITHKVETHNTPSALDPFGGAITGIVGVNRDALGFGLGAKPVFNTYAFCFADPDDEKPLYRDQSLAQKMLSPKRIMEGVIEGINAGGNQSGIPTPQGLLYFDDRYKGKPLVFAGTVGLIPKKVGGKNATEKKAKPGDYIVMLGGKVGIDGIHGATFSSEGLHTGSPAAAVQIGDPITQKKFSDALVKEARDMNLYNSITDNGAGGLSSSVGEMANESGGAVVDLDKVPLKYPGLDPWQIWISESQERMTLSVPKSKWRKFEKLLKSRGVEAWVIGEFNKSGKCVVKYKGKTVMDLDLEFLHNGLPKRQQLTTYNLQLTEEPNIPVPKDLTKTFLGMLDRLNITSYDFISTQYDHTVQGTAVTYPVQGKGRVNSEAHVVKPVYESDKGLVLSQGMYPSYSEIDPYNMAASSIDTAVKNAIVAGADPGKIALLDNFCWCSSNEPKRLGQLINACRAVYDVAVAYGTPYISGKDSMFNDFKGYDEKGKEIKISIPPTLLISSIGITENVMDAVTIDFKMEGDLIYVLGETFDEAGGSEYFKSLGALGNTTPKVDTTKNLKLYKAYAKALKQGLIVSGIGINIGGLGVALAKSALAGDVGVDINLKDLPGKVSREDLALYSQSQGRILVSINPKNKSKFEQTLKGNALSEIGKVTKGGQIKIKGLKGNLIVDTKVDEALRNYKRRFKDW